MRRALARRSGATTFTTADLATPSVNIAYGSYYLRYLLDRYGASKLLALSAYNAGEANVILELAGQSAAGQGVSTDIIEAAAHAYVRALSNAERKVALAAEAVERAGRTVADEELTPAP